MTITEADIKILAAERELDDPDGGGFMTSNVIVSGVENNLFPDISSLDRATGALDFRKFFAAVLTPGTEVYLGSHLIVDAIPEDDNVAGLMFSSASAGETRTQLITRLNSTAAIPAYGCKPLMLDAAIADRTVKVDGLDVMLIPASNVGDEVTGEVTVAEGVGFIGNAMIEATSDAPVLRVMDGNSYGIHRLGFLMRHKIGSVSGTFTDLAVTSAPLTDLLIDNPVTSGTAPSKYPVLRRNAEVPTQQIFFGQTQVAFKAVGDTGVAQDVTSVSATYRPMFMTRVPAEIYEFTWNYGMSSFQSFTLPHLPEVGSETLVWSNLGVNDDNMLAPYNGSEVFSHVLDNTTNYDSTCTIDRSTGIVTAVFTPQPKVGSKVRMAYIRAGYAQGIADTCIDGAFTSNAVHLTPTSGWHIDQAVFTINSNYYIIESSGDVRAAPPYLGGAWGGVVGSFNKSTSTLNMILADGETIDDWWGVEVKDLIPTSAMFGSIPADLDPGSLTFEGVTLPAETPWTATTDASGTITGSLVVSGNYNKLTGAVEIDFSENIATAITYTADLLSFIKTPDEITGLSGASYPTSGRVNVFRANQVAVVHNTKSVSGTYVNTDTVNFGRTLIAEARVYNASGVEYTTGFTVNKATGILTFTDVSGMVMPVTVKNRVEDMALIISASADGELHLSKGLQHAYDADADDCWVSSVLILDDLQAKSHPGFQQVSWTGVFSDTIIGAGISADYNEAANPIVVTNHGAITQRWAVRFKNTTDFELIGEETGIIATGNTGNPFAPINPGTGYPYFTIPSAGWGSGWATGNVYRFNTDGANAPAWVVRSIAPSDPFVGQDKITVAVRGDIDA